MLDGLFHEHYSACRVKLLTRRNRRCMEFVEIETRRKRAASAIGCIPDRRVGAGSHLSLKEGGHFLTEYVVDAQPDGACLGQGEGDCRRRVKRVRIILIDRITGG